MTAKTCPFCESLVDRVGDAVIEVSDPNNDNPLAPRVPAHLSCAYRIFREKTCPRCNESDWVLAAQLWGTLEAGSGRFTTQTASGDADLFMSLECRSCQLTLMPEAGDGRIRRADLVDGAADYDPKNESPPVIDNDEWRLAMAAIAEFGIELFR